MNSLPDSLRDPTTIQAVSFVLYLAALPLVAFGTVEGVAVAWWLGLALIVVAGILPPTSRFLGSDDEDDGEDEEGTDDAADDRDDPAQEREDGATVHDGPRAAPPPEGPVGPPPTGPGRDPGRARVEEQHRHTDALLDDTTHEGDGR